MLPRVVQNPKRNFFVFATAYFKKGEISTARALAKQSTVTTLLAVCSREAEHRNNTACSVL